MNYIKYSSFHYKTGFILGFPGGSVVKNPPANIGKKVQTLGLEDPQEKEMATHSSILSWEIPCTQEPGGLESMGLQSVRQFSD